MPAASGFAAMTSDERGRRDALLDQLGLSEKDSPAVPFAIDVADAPKNIPWKRSVTRTGDGSRDVTWEDATTHLRIAAHVRVFDDFPAFDYFLTITNTSPAADAPVLGNLRVLSTKLPLPGPLVLYHANGSHCAVDDFQPHRTPLDSVSPPPLRLRPGPSARSSDGVLPLFNLAGSDGGVAGGIGWTGMWDAEFSPDGTVTAGMRPGLSLHPGESFRAQRVMLLTWSGPDRLRGNNLLRQWVLKHSSPQETSGGPVIPPVSFNSAFGIVQSGHATNESQEIARAEVAASLGVELYVLDAYWFPQPWWSGVGNWTPRPADFPHGLRPIADAVHGRGMTFGLWFEPERAFANSEWLKAHPEFYTSIPGADVSLLNLGNAAARRAMTDFLAGRIEQWGIDWYRQDFNFDPGPFWGKLDVPRATRMGSAEVAHIAGLYAMWDDLLRRRPGLKIDNCASGGRRIDLETMSRSVPLWRSDWPDLWLPQPPLRPQIPQGNQIGTLGLAQFAPLFSMGASEFDPYAFRSALGPGVVVYTELLNRDAAALAQIKRAVEECKSLRPYWLGDFYPLTPDATPTSDVCAYQFDRPDLAAGFALYFFRPGCKTLTQPAALRAIDPHAGYEVTTSADYDAPAAVMMSGTALATTRITAPAPRTAILVRYRRK
jgi:alpha-galactosidase